MNESKKKRILIVEDEMHIAEGLKLNLRLQGHEVKIAPDGADALRQWKEWRPDLVVLDIMLPVLDGLSVLRNIRLEDEKIPILILSAKNASDDKVKGLSYGVDDYLAKPFDLQEFLLRVERLLLRASWADPGRESMTDMPSLGDNYRFGDNYVDFLNGTARCKQGDIQLTEQELKLLKLFITHRGKALSRARLLEIGWGYTRKTTTRTVDNFIARFRKYFEDDTRNPVFFKSRRSVGYLFEHEEDANGDHAPD